jgi:hypothetical protein
MPRKKQRRQEDEKDKLRIEFHLRKTRKQGDKKSRDDQQDGKRKIDSLRHHGQHADDAEKSEKGLIFSTIEVLGMPDAWAGGQWWSEVSLRNVLAWPLGQCIRCLYGFY